jgi:hypothetical protein
MPRIDDDTNDIEIRAEAMEAARADFLAGFRPTRKGGLWRTYSDDGERTLTLTVFQDKYGRYCYCVSSPEGPRFSEAKYDTQELALSALWWALTGW